MTIFELETAPQSFPEDYHQENGNYLNCCIFCNRHFTGHKRRDGCKLCQTQDPAIQVALDQDARGAEDNK